MAKTKKIQPAVIPKEAGRPPVIDEITLKKLEEAFAIGASDTEACFYANISPATLYNFQKNNPYFLERKNALKEKPILKARQEVVKGLDGNPEFSLKFLEKKKRDEFGNIHEIQHTGTVKQINEIRDLRFLVEIKEKYEGELREAIIKKIKESEQV